MMNTLIAFFDDSSSIMGVLPYYVTAAAILVTAEFVLLKFYKPNFETASKLVRVGLFVMYYSGLLTFAIHSSIRKEYWLLTAYCIAMLYPFLKNRLQDGLLTKNKGAQ
jgi:hypothetical protein